MAGKHGRLQSTDLAVLRFHTGGAVCRGVIDGGGFKSFKPRLVQFQRSQNVRIDDVTLRNSGMW